MSAPQTPRQVSRTAAGGTAAAVGGRPRPALPQGPYLVLGLGRAGLAAADALTDLAGADAVSVWDDSERSRARARAASGLGPDIADDGPPSLAGVCTVVKSPGIELSHPLLGAARRRGLAVIDELELGWRLSGAPMVAVTGTNGKTTTCTVIAAVLQAHGLSPALVGNAEPGRGIPLSALQADHDGWVVAEVSSYQASGLDMLLPDAAVFTNLTPDHLHWHGSMAAYGTAKRRVFVDGERGVALGVVNIDDPFGAKLAEEIRERGGQTLTYGTGAGADYRIVQCRWGAGDGELELATPQGSTAAHVHLAGPHNGSNVAAAIAVADGLGLERHATLEAVANVKPPPGRLERIEAGQPFEVLVDFAHSQDSIGTVLVALRAVAKSRGGRLLVVLGLAPTGERATREACGAAARSGCDHLILSAWSLRGEPALVALAGALAGARSVEGSSLEVVRDRRRAIARGLSLAREEDVVAVLGRGAVGLLALDKHSPLVAFDDRAVVRELLG